MAKPSVVDISHWQTEPDFTKVKAGGVVGIILKATEGTGYVDPTFMAREEKARKAGLITSSYHFLKHGSIGAQMSHYMRTAAPPPGGRVVIDYEDAACTLDDLRAAVNELMPLQVQITIYGANGFLGAQLGGKRDELLATCPLWVASYTTNSQPTTKDLAATWPVWSLWQYTDKATVSGFSAPVDGNVFNGTDEQLVKWLSPAGSVPALVPQPPVEAPIVTVSINSDTPVNIVLAIGPNVTLA